MIFFQRFYTGWITLRNQLTEPVRLMGRRVISLLDALIAGHDLEITPRLSLQRRPGYISYAPAVMNGTLLNMYSWRSASNGIFQVFDTTVDIEFIAPGVLTPTVIFTKPAGSIGNKSYFFGVGNYLFVSGSGFQFKWDGGNPQGVTNWGISIGSISDSVGPNTAGTGVNSGAAPHPSWVNPANVSSAVNYTTVAVTQVFPGFVQTSKNLQATQFGFTIPATTTVTGISVSFSAFTSSGSSPFYLSVVLMKNGNIAGTAKTQTLSATSTVYTIGGISDLWGGSWIANDLSQTNFGVQITATVPVGPSGITTFSVRNVQVTMFGVGGPNIAVNATSGSFSAVNGYTYVFAYGNSVSGEISNATPPSLNTGAFTNKLEVDIALTASTDSQVNQIHLYRTTDSGGGSLFYELPNSPFPNTTASVADQSPDTGLQVNSLAAVNFENTPPPANLTAMEWFAGRLWGVVNNLLYFSTGPDSFSGLEQSNWNPAYVFVLPTNIQRNVATPNGMLSECLDDCYIVRGTATTTFTVNEFARDIAGRSYNAVDTDGSNIYIFTTDRQLLQIGGAGMNDIGQVIGDQLLNIDPSQVYVTIYRYGLDSMLFVLDTVNGILYPFNIPQQCWCLPGVMQFTTKPSAAGAMEITPGVWKYIMGTGTSLAQRDLNTFSDLGNPYSPQAVIGAITLADPLSLAKVENIILQLTKAGNVPNLSIIANDSGVTLTNPIGSQVTGKFTDMSVQSNPIQEPPTYAAQATAFRNLRYQWALTPLPAQIQLFQALLQWGPELAQNELIGFGISGKQAGDTPGAGKIPELQGH